MHHKIVFWDIVLAEAVNVIDYVNSEGGTSHIDIAVSPDNLLLVIQSGANLWGFDTQSGEVVGRIKDVVGDGLVFAIDGRSLYQCASDPVIQVWGLPDS